MPVSSVPSAAGIVAIGELTVTVRVVGSVPVFVSVSTVTATLSCVMNLRWATRRPVAVWTLDQWLGYWRRSAVVSASVAPETATVYRLWLSPVGPLAVGVAAGEAERAGLVRVHVERAPARVEVACPGCCRNGRSSTRSNQYEPPASVSAS